MNPAYLVGVGGALGAVLRHAVSLMIPDGGAVPRGTLVVNVVGSFALGLVAFSNVGGQVALLVGTGACGAFTTFSSFSYETVRLAETGRKWTAAINGAVNLVGALLGVAVAALLVG